MRFRLPALFGLLLAANACEPAAPAGPSDPATETYAASLGVDIASMTKVDGNLYYKDITIGTGTTATAGKTAVSFCAGKSQLPRPEIPHIAFARLAGTHPAPPWVRSPLIKLA